jgi:hypothetical protein
MHNGREPNNNRGLDPRSPEKISTRELGNIVGDLKEPLCTGSPCMDNTLRDTLPVKLRKLLNQMIVLKEDRSCKTTKSSTMSSQKQTTREVLVHTNIAFNHWPGWNKPKFDFVSIWKFGLR